MATYIWVNIGSGNGLLPDRTKPLPDRVRLTQCWLLVNEVLWQSPEINFTANAQLDILYNEFENGTFEITATSLRGQSWARENLSYTGALRTMRKIWASIFRENETTSFKISNSISLVQGKGVMLHVKYCVAVCELCICFVFWVVRRTWMRVWREELVIAAGRTSQTPTNTSSPRSMTLT